MSFWGRALFQNRKGYTFIELGLVIFLIGLFFSLATPRLRDALLTDSLKSTSRKIVGMIKEIRNDAIRDHKDYRIHFDLESDKFWVDTPSMSEEEQDMARKKAFSLPEGVRITDIWSKEKGKQVSGTAGIFVDRRGYLQHSVIHMEAQDGRQFTLELNPFMGKVKILDTYVEYEGRKG